MYKVTQRPNINHHRSMPATYSCDSYSSSYCYKCYSTVIAPIVATTMCTCVVTWSGLHHRHEFKCCGPVLLVVPADMLAFWEGEFEFWGGREVNVVTYSGCAQARGIVLENDVWLQPSSMDGKSATYQSREALPDKVCLLPPVHVG